jgi:hypothetical protein
MNFRSTLLTAASALALSALATGAFAANVSATANATATILSTTTVTKQTDMAFGQVVRPSNASTQTVSMDSNGNVTILNPTGTGDASVIAGTTTAASFKLVSPADTYSTTQTLVFTQTGLTNAAAATPVATAGAYGTVPAAGTQVLNVGGSFEISATTPAQAYTGTLTLTVAFN